MRSRWAEEQASSTDRCADRVGRATAISLLLPPQPHPRHRRQVTTRLPKVPARRNPCRHRARARARRMRRLWAPARTRALAACWARLKACLPAFDRLVSAPAHRPRRNRHRQSRWPHHLKVRRRRTTACHPRARSRRLHLRASTAAVHRTSCLALHGSSAPIPLRRRRPRRPPRLRYPRSLPCSLPSST